MKKTIVQITATTIGIFFSFAAFAQQQVSTAKPPEVSGPVLQQSTTESKTVAPAPANDKDLHQTATKQSSVANEPKLVKGKDDVQPAKAVQTQQLPQTDKIIPPNTIKYKDR